MDEITDIKGCHRFGSYSRIEPKAVSESKLIFKFRTPDGSWCRIGELFKPLHLSSKLKPFLIKECQTSIHNFRVIQNAFFMRDLF